MRTKTSSLLFLVCGVAGLVAVPPPLAAGVPCNPDVEDCTLGEIYKTAFFTAFPRDVVKAADVAAAVTNSNVATTPPDAFAGRIHSSYQDFLNLFSFAINKVEESKDGQALTVRFNPLREGQQLLGFSFTAAKPAIADSVSQAIPEADRTATITKLQSRQSDLDDLTYALAYSLESVKCSWDRPASSRCWGRTPKVYMDMLGRVLPGGTPQIRKADTQLENRLMVLTHIKDENGNLLHPGNVWTKKLSTMDAKSQTEAVQIIRNFAARDIKETQAEKAKFDKSDLDKLASLVDNQPQLAATASYRDPGRYGGQKETGLSFELQFGRYNLNKLRRDCDGEGIETCAIQKLQDFAQSGGLSTDKFVLTATFKRRDPFRLASLGLDAPVPGFAPIDLRRSTEFKAKFQWGIQLDPQVTGKHPRFDLSADGTVTRNDPSRTKNRWVATATLTLPLGEKMSLPVSLNYANRSEFLTAQRKQFGAHLGLTYRLPFEKNTS